MKIGDRVRVKRLMYGVGLLVDFDSELGFKICFDRDDLYNDAYYPIEEIELEKSISDNLDKFTTLMTKLDALESIKDDILKETYNCIKAKLYIKYGG